MLNIDEDGDGKYDLKLQAGVNGYGEEVKIDRGIYIILQICLIGGNGFCAAAGEDELKRRWEDLGMRCRVFYLLENDWDMEGMIWQIE